MSQQKIVIATKNGADSRRVLDTLTPLNGTAAPAVNALFLGQIFIDTQNADFYISVAVGSEVPANDWQKISS